MNTFCRPLVALSLTEPDAELLCYASQAAVEGCCEAIRFAYVASPRSIAREANAVRRLRDQVRSEVDAQFRGAARHVECDVAVGSRLDELLTLAVKHRHDVILLGHRRGRSGRRSLARQLAMVAPCSVWLIPQGSPDRIHTILVPVDFSRNSADALSLATSLAAGVGLEQCLALHVFFDSSTLRYPEHIEVVCGQEQDVFKRFVATVACHGVSVEPIFVESTHPPQAILRLAERHEADLIVMSTRGRTHASALLLGSVTSKIMATASVPVLAVKHFGAHESLLEVLLDRRLWRDGTPKTS